MTENHNELAAARAEIEKLREAMPCSACGSVIWEVHHCLDCVFADTSAVTTSDNSQIRYFVDHGVIHDRETGRHVTVEQAADLLSVSSRDSNALAWKTVAELGKRLSEATDRLVAITNARDAACEIATQLIKSGAAASRIWELRMVGVK